MDKEREEVKDFNICFGGIFSKPSSGDISEADLWNSYATRSSFLDVLRSEDNIEKVFEIQEDKAEELMKFVGPIGVALGGEEDIVTNWWSIPVIFKMNVKKGFRYEYSNGMTDVIQSPLKAMVLYDGIWFMAIYEPNQCSDIGEAFWLKPRIRDILVEIIKKGGKFIPQIVPPCVMEVDISLEIISRVEEGRDIKSPEYDSSEKCGEDGSELSIGYINNKDKVVDDDIAMIMLDIYSSVGRDIQSYYLLEALSQWHQKRRDKMMEEYSENCAAVEKYLKIPNLNVVKKSIISNRLSKKMMSLQMKLVNNAIWDNKVIRKSVEIDSYQDKIGIMDHIREELKRSITEPYEQSREEYEGVMSTISSIEKMTSQHSFVLLSIVAVIAGFTGGIISSVIG